MVNVVCDNCEHLFEVDEAATGGRVNCPECGDVNRVEAETAQDAISDTVAPQEPVPTPATDEGLQGKRLPPDHGPEQQICVIRPAMFRAHPFRGVMLVTLGIGGVVLAFLAAATDSVPAWLAWPGLLMMLGAAAWWFAWYVSACLMVKLRISNKRCIRREGIIRRHTSEVLHDHVRNVEIKQSFVQRVFDVGYLGISSSGQDDIEIEILDIPRPNRVKALIDEYREM